VRCSAIDYKQKDEMPDQFKDSMSGEVMSKQAKEAFDYLTNKRLFEAKKKEGCPGYEGEFDIPAPNKTAMVELKKANKIAKENLAVIAAAEAIEKAIIYGDD